MLIESDKEEKNINILDLFSLDEMTQTSQGYKMECPDCGLQGGRTEGFVIFPDSNTAYCHSSNKWFKMLEAYALKKKIIRCLDGRDKGDSSSKILGGELFTLTLDEAKNEFGTDMYNKLVDQLKIRKSIELPGNNRYQSNFADDLGDIYKSRNVLFFRGALGKIYEIHRYSKINNSGKIYVENGFREVESNRFITLAEMFIKPWTIIYTKNGPMRVDKSMTQSDAVKVLSSPNFQDKIPTIVRIFDIQIPIMFKDKNGEMRLTFPKKGYDKRFESWLPYNAPQIKEDLFTLQEAKNMIDKIFEEFCFATEKDRTHAIAAFITPFLRGLFPKFSTRTPVFIYMANRERAGKDYCAGCNGILYEGVNIEEPAISNDEKGNSNANEEIRKKIIACMMQGKKRFHSANNKGLLNNSVLEGVTTAEVWSDRILGASKVVTFDNELDYSLSGNLGIRLTPDLANRARIINLHLVDEDANAREFKNPKLHEWIFENRGAIISALYILVKNWVDKGQPKGTVPFTSFPHWAEICGGIMESCGYDNPCKSDKSMIISLDVETEEMKHLFEACYSKNPNKWMCKDDIKAIIESEGIMSYMDFNNQADKVKFGIKIDKFVKRILSGIMMNVDSLEQRASRRKYNFTQAPNFINVGISPQETEVGKDGSLGRVHTLVHDSYIKASGSIGETLPNLPTLPKNPSNSSIMADFDHNSSQNQVLLFPQEMKVELKNLEDFSKKYKDSLKNDIQIPIEKEKSDRELQFYESPETKDIILQCTKEQVLEWIKMNPGASLEQMDSVLGLGCLKYALELKNEGLVERNINRGWISNEK